MKDKSEKESAKLFSVPDFVGDACKAIASRIRGAVAGVQFDDFHKVERNVEIVQMNDSKPDLAREEVLESKVK